MGNRCVRRAAPAPSRPPTCSLRPRLWNRREVLITLLSEVATDYISLRGYQEQITIARQNLEAQQRTADLTRRRQRGGFQTGLDVANADATVASTLSAIPPLEQEAQQTIYALSLLLSVPPATLQSELSPRPRFPSSRPRFPSDCRRPCSRRRPNVRNAEMLLKQQTAQVGAAIASLYPSFSLTGAGGTQGNRFGNLGELSTRFWNFGPSINWPILDFGSVHANIELQRAQEEEALYTWQATVIQSLTDVENALIAYTKEQQHRQSLAEAVVANKKAVELSTLLYSNGQTDFLNVLVAEQSLFSLRKRIGAEQHDTGHQPRRPLQGIRRRLGRPRRPVPPDDAADGPDVEHSRPAGFVEAAEAVRGNDEL